MATRIEVKYFNTFWLKKTIWKDGLEPDGTALGSPSYGSAWPGLEWNPYATSTISSKLAYPIGANTVVGDDQEYNYVIEEARIRGGFNNTSTDYGAKAYTVETNTDSTNRFNSLIHSGIYNSTTELNEINVFSVADSITKSIDPNFGSIQKIYSEDTNLLIMQENKISKALIDKNAIYSAEGGGSVTSSNIVIGQIVPYLGEYGVSRNPESFAVFGFRKYFTDRDRSAVLRLSRDGITEISQHGMRDYFRDELSDIQDEYNIFSTEYTFGNSQDPAAPPVGPIPFVGYTQRITTLVAPTDIEPGMTFAYQPLLGSPIQTALTVTGVSASFVYLDGYAPVIPNNSELIFTKVVKDKAVGGFDTYNDVYLLSLQQPRLLTDGSDVYSTLCFDESSGGWVSFYDFMPSQIIGFKNNLYTTTSSGIWVHNSSNVLKNSFYGSEPKESSVEFIFNPNPSVTKNFNTISYEGGNGWEVDYFKSDLEGIDQVGGVIIESQDTSSSVMSYDGGKYTEGGVIYRVGFNRKENRYVANLINSSTERPGEVIFGSSISGVKGYFATVKLSTDVTTDIGGPKELFAVGTNYVISSY